MGLPESYDAGEADLWWDSFGWKAMGRKCRRKGDCDDKKKFSEAAAHVFNER